MMGRNEPCPCGSAVKYKRCCLRRVEAIARELRVRDAILADIVDWVRNEHPAVVDEASHQTALIRMLRGPAGRNMSLVWAINDFRTPDGDPPLTERYATLPELDPDTRAVVRGLADATLDLFRVNAAITDQSVTLEPLRGGEQITVMTDHGFAGLEVGEILVARIVHATSVSTVWGSVMRFPAESERRWRARLEQVPTNRAQAALALLEFHPDDAVEPLPEDVTLVEINWTDVDGDAVLEELETDPLLECTGQAVPDAWAFSWLDDADSGFVDLGGWPEGDEQIETARLLVRERGLTLVSGDRETLRAVASHVERELGAMIVPAGLPHAA
jgi:hypothetical protein